MIRAHSPGAVMFSATLHAAVLSALVAGALWMSRGKEVRTRGGEFVIVPKGDLALPGDANAAPSTRPLDYHPSKVPRVSVPAPVPDTVPDARPESSERHGKMVTSERPSNRSASSVRPVRTAATARPAVPGPATAIPQIDGDALAADLVAKGNVSSKDGSNATHRNEDAGSVGAALDRYFDRLTVALRGAHDMPEGVDTLYLAQVSFYLGADGSLSAVRVLNPSGNPAYDRSVVAAFAKVRSIGAVPGGQAGTYTLSFKMTE